MRTRLLSATAIAAAALPAAPAMAEGPSLSISGSSDFAYILQDADGPGAGVDGTDGDAIQAGDGATEIHFDAEATADNGLTYGASLEWRTGSDTIDESFVFFEGGWGRVHLGGDDSAIDDMVVGGADVLGGDVLYDGEHQVFAANGLAQVAVALDADTGDANKLTYYSPSFGGLTFGASYIPDTASPGLTAGVQNSPNGNGGQFEGVAKYEGSFGAGDFAVSLGYANGEGGLGMADREGLEAGATVSVGGFAVGVGYGDNFDTGLARNATADAGTFWNVGTSYSFGAASVYAGYAAAAQDDGAGGEDEADYVGIGADYALAEGLLAYTEYAHSTADDASAGTSAETDYLLVGTIVSY